MEIKLETGSSCFMCFGSLEGSHDQRHHNENDLSPSILTLFRYLEIDIGEAIKLGSVINGDPYKTPASLETRAKLCSQCQRVHSKFEELVLLQEKIKLELNEWLGRIRTRLKASWSTPAQDSLTGPSFMSVGNEILVSPAATLVLRKKLEQKCQAKFQAKGSHPEAEVGRRNSKKHLPAPAASSSSMSGKNNDKQFDMDNFLNGLKTKGPSLDSQHSTEEPEGDDEDGPIPAIEVKAEPEDLNSWEGFDGDLCPEGEEDPLDMELDPDPDLQQPSASSSSTPRFLCSLCPNSYKFKYQLKQHHEINHLGIRYHCDICGKAFTTQGAIKLHQVMVNCGAPKEDKTEKPSSSKNGNQRNGRKVTCDICQAQVHPESLNQHHKLVHMKIKDFECIHCGQEFSTKSHMNRHIRNVHMGVKYECEMPGCEKVYATQYRLNLHMKKDH